ncbi:UBN2 domain-containing protein [Cephalotus follicularis]|uniref:UBN2 domain-containing protein n=1 Tax=Cephalotus follicularis TaxID=3775 RepID=A0A1Q3BJF6_CEPFO|nr:UBN2 domain-containing protein [Cephalotus follicularis]
MEIYLKSRDLRNWLSVKDGPHTPMKLNDKNELVSKPEDEWDEDDFRKFTIDNKALNILLVSLDKTEYNLVRRCTSAHEVWKFLILTHEGTEQVKNAKLALLIRDYELFKMQPNESIKNLYNRLLDITLEKEVESLREKNVNLEKSFSKFTLGSKKLEEMLGSQRSYLDKTGIGYAPLEAKAKLKKARIRPHCTYCNKMGHTRNK